MHFYQSPCPPQMTAQINHQQSVAMQPNQGQHATVITINDEKDIQQHSDGMMSTLIEHIKPEIMNPVPQQIIHHTHAGTTTTQTTTTSRGSKPQACKVCGKVLSSASSYYVHMKLHSGTKPFNCKSFKIDRSSCV